MRVITLVLILGLSAFISFSILWYTYKNVQVWVADAEFISDPSEAV